MSIARLLAQLGYGTRKEAERLLAARRVTTEAGTVVADRDAVPHEALRVDGAPLDPPAGSVILLYKPVGFVCSTSDRPPLVYDLLPPRFLHRKPVMAPVGRLDADTSGLLLLTDDGPLNHRLTSPKRHVPKVYEATLAEPMQGHEAALFASGTLRLQGDPQPLRPADLEVLSATQARLTLHEGRYHQVRRMFAAAGNHVVALRRVALGPLTLDGVDEGSWRVLSAPEVAALRARPAAGESPDAT
jgi:16S rRNA pseudouridine516 synthase